MIDSPNALDLLKSQHDAIDELFARVASADVDDRQARLRELAEMLAAHAAIEQQVFYPAIVSEETADVLLDSVEDHAEIEHAIDEMLELEPESIAFGGYLTLLADDVRRHARVREEAELFPLVADMLDDDQLESLGAELLSRFEELEPSWPVAPAHDSYTLAR
jgi:hypothetical protein